MKEELKTLKNIEISANKDFMHYHKLRKSDPIVDKQSLKQEAIKWIKEIRKVDFTIGVDLMMKFFNITEDDLQ